MALLMKIGKLCLRPVKHGQGLPRSLSHLALGTRSSCADISVSKCHHKLAPTKCKMYSQLFPKTFRKEGIFLVYRNFKTASKDATNRNKLLPFERERYVDKDTLLYERPTHTPWNILGVIGVFMCGCFWYWSYNHWFIVEELYIKQRRYNREVMEAFRKGSCVFLVLFGRCSLLYRGLANMNRHRFARRDEANT